MPRCRRGPDLLNILEERYSRRSTIITSEIPIDKWRDLMGDPLNSESPRLPGDTYLFQMPYDGYGFFAFWPPARSRG